LFKTLEDSIEDVNYFKKDKDNNIITNNKHKVINNEVLETLFAILNINIELD
jgi:hypothetical protein